MILFEVETVGRPTIKLWECNDLFLAWHNYYSSLKENCVIDYLSGSEQLEAVSHPKKLANSSGNAKLVSNNDSSNYTYRGRFQTSDEALTIGYESSQKAHQFLRYLIQDRGILCDTQAIVAYRLGSREKVFCPINSSKDIFDELLAIKPSLAEQLSSETGRDYAHALKLSLRGFFNKGTDSILQNANSTIVMAFDAATTGRLSITYYRELYKDEYLEKIAEWHDSCKWHLVYFDENKAPVRYIGTPSVDRIIEAVYGRARGGNDDGYNKIKKSARERLLHCIFDGESLPKDYIFSAVRRASNPVSMSSSEFSTILATTCSMVRKFFKQQFKEDYKLALEPDRTDRDYLYGRLLGAADKLEEYINYKEKNDRITNALRYMNPFSQHPFKTWSVIKNSLIPYEQKLRGKRNLAQDEIQKIMGMFEVGAYEDDSPLNGSYLLGYYLERAEIDRQVAELANRNQEEN